MSDRHALESAVLFKRFPELRLEPLLIALNRASQPLGQSFALLEKPVGNLVVLASEDFHAVVTLHESPLPQARFAAALDSRFARDVGPRPAGAVRRHRRAVTVEVGAGATPHLPRRRAPGFAGAREDVRRSSTLIVLCHALTAALCREPGALAVHWGQSDRVLTPQSILRASFPMPVEICIHPQVFSSGSTAGGQPMAGLRAHGSEAILGRLLIVHETVLPLPDVLSFCAAILSRGPAVDQIDGPEWMVEEELGLAAEIRSRPPSVAFPSGTIELMIEDLPKGSAARKESALRDTFRRRGATPPLAAFRRGLDSVRAMRA